MTADQRLIQQVKSTEWQARIVDLGTLAEGWKHDTARASHTAPYAALAETNIALLRIPPDFAEFLLQASNYDLIIRSVLRGEGREGEIDLLQANKI